MNCCLADMQKAQKCTGKPHFIYKIFVGNNGAICEKVFYLQTEPCLLVLFKILPAYDQLVHHLVINPSIVSSTSNKHGIRYNRGFQKVMVAFPK